MIKFTQWSAVKNGLRTLAAGCALAGSAAIGAEMPYTALYVFGDSYSDTGARYLDGNGPTPVGYLAKNMGIALTHSKDPNPGNKSVNFSATAASTGVDKGPGEWCCQGMMDQVNDFAARVRSKAVSFNPQTTLFFLAGGLNDTDVATEVTVGNIKNQVHTLQSLGARHFTLSLLPTLVPDFAAVGKRLNPAYERLVMDLKSKGVDIHLNQWGPYLDDIMRNPAQHGIVNTTAQCAGRALFKEDATPCAKPDTYFYFHSGHPSMAVNRIVGEKLHREINMLDDMGSAKMSGASMGSDKMGADKMSSDKMAADDMPHDSSR